MATVTFDQALDFTRPSEATYIGADGLIKTAAVDEPRFTHDPETGEPLGLLIEEQRTNLWLFPADLSANTSFVAGSALAPNGSTGYKLIIDDGLTRKQTAFSVGSGISAGASCTYSVFVKPDGHNTFTFISANAGQINPEATFDLGAMSAPTGGRIEPCANGWFRCSLTREALQDVSIGQYVRVTGTGDGVKGMYFFGGQIEAGGFASSYIPIVSDSQVTRAADNCSRTLGAEFNPSEGTFFAEFEFPQPIVSESQRVFSYRANITVNRGTISLYRGTDNVLRGQVFGLSTRIVTLGTFESGKAKAAISYVSDGSGSLVCLNGNPPLPFGDIGQFGGFDGPDRQLCIGDLRDGSGQHMNGVIAKIKYIPRALTAEELQTLTAPEA